MVEVEKRIRALMERGECESLESIGGEATLYEDAGVLAGSALFPVIVHLVCDEWQALTDRPRATGLLLSGFASNPSPLALSDSLDALLSTPVVARQLGSRLSSTLLDRVRLRSSEMDAELAARALDGAVRLALGGAATRFALLDELTRTGGNEHPGYAGRAARLIGVCHEQWAEPELISALERLLDVPEAESNAAFELGMVHLRGALESDSDPAVGTGLLTARTWLSRSEAAEEDRTDALLYGDAIDVLLSFKNPGALSFVQARLERLNRTVRVRHGWLSRMNSGWLQPRAEAEYEWISLAACLTRASRSLGRNSWLDARSALAQVVETYRASRSVRLWVWSDRHPAGLDLIIEPRVTAAFVRERGLRQHLEDWVAELPGDDLRRGPAEDLLGMVAAQLARTTTGVDPGNGGSPQPPCGDCGTGPEARTSLWERAEIVIESKSRSPSPIVDQAYRSTLDALAPCEDFTGEVREDFSALVLLTLRFLKSRQDARPTAYSGRAAYLYTWEAGESPPLERALADDYQQWIDGSDIGVNAYSEVRDIGGGRVDVLLEYGTHRLVVELKREFDDTSREGLRPYLGQTALYQATNVTLGVLLVLDLTDKRQGVPDFRSNVWVDIVPARPSGDRPRYVVVVRIPGNRRVPNAAANPFTSP